MNKIAIVGGGISGLACALSLTRHNAEVRLYESNNNLGGRIKDFWVGDTHLSLGAKTISANHRSFMSLLREMGLSTSVVKSRETIGIFTDGRLITLRPLSILFDGTIPPRTKVGLLRLKRYLGKLTSGSMDSEMTSISLRDFVLANYPDGVLDDFIEPLAGAFFGESAQGISAWSGLQVISGAFEKYELVHGFAPLIRTIESTLAGRIVKGAKVERIEVKTDGGFSLKLGGKVDEADHAICCVPVPDLKRMVAGISYPEVTYVSKTSYAIEGESRFPRIGQLVNGDPEYRTDVIHFRGRYATLSSVSENPDLTAFFKSAKVLTAHRWPYCSPRSKPGVKQPTLDTEIPNLYKSGDMIYGGGLEACTRAGIEVAGVVLRKIAAG